MRNKPVALGTLNEDHGVMTPTPSHAQPSHHTWWVPLGAEPWVDFTVLNRN